MFFCLFIWLVGLIESLLKKKKVGKKKQTNRILPPNPSQMTTLESNVIAKAINECFNASWVLETVPTLARKE